MKNFMNTNMKRAMIKIFDTHEECNFGELERSGNPWCEFHTVVKLYETDNFDTEIIDNVFEKLTERKNV